MLCQLGLAALQRARSKPIDTVTCLLPRARGLAETWRHSLLRDPGEAELSAMSWALFALCQIPAIVGRAVRYRDFSMNPVGWAWLLSTSMLKPQSTSSLLRRRTSIPGHF